MSDQELNRLQIQSARGIMDFVEKARAIRRTWRREVKAEEIWYRGIANRDHALIPKVYRDVTVEDGSNSLFVMFKSLAPAYLNGIARPSDDWEWYVLAQHYGLPTRLLDWTASPLVAAFFAIEDAQAGGKSPCVWMIDAGSLNAISIKDDKIIAPGGEFSNRWLNLRQDEGEDSFEFRGERYSRSLPIAILPYQGEPRIAAQQGRFTIHGSEPIAIDKVFGQSQEARHRRIARIDLSDDLVEMRHELSDLGVLRAAVFPDLTSVVKDIVAFHRNEATE